MKDPEINIELTKADHLLEAVGWTLLLVLWAMIIYIYYHTPDIVPIHFNAIGEADGYGDRSMVFLTGVIATVLFVMMTAIGRVPAMFNFPEKRTAENAQQQFTAAAKMLRFAKIGVALIFIMVEMYSYKAAIGESTEEYGKYLLPVTMLLTFVPAIFYFLKRKKK